MPAVGPPELVVVVVVVVPSLADADASLALPEALSEALPPSVELVVEASVTDVDAVIEVELADPRLSSPLQPRASVARIAEVRRR